MADLTRQAQKDLDQLPPGLRKRADDLISRLDAEPAIGAKLLGALQGIRAARLGRSYRVLYKTRPSGLVVIAVRPRRDAYK